MMLEVVDYTELEHMPELDEQPITGGWWYRNFGYPIKIIWTCFIIRWK